MSTLGGAQLDHLRRLKLGALVTSRWGADDGRAFGAFPGGASAVGGLGGANPTGGDGPGVSQLGGADGHAPRQGWVLVDDGSSRALGPALAWAVRHDLAALHLLVAEDGSGPSAHSAGASLGPSPEAVVREIGVAAVLARRAQALRPAPTIWRVVGDSMAAAEPAPILPLREDLPPSWRAFADLLVAHGAQAVLEHGILRGEVLGLEVARLVEGPDGWELSVGVGRHDREARALMRGGQDPGDGLDEVVADVLARRQVGATPHPANTLARERWLRAVLVAHPEWVGASALQPVAPSIPRANLLEAAPAAAVGVDPSGSALIVMCTVTPDLDAVAAAGDLWLSAGADPSCRVVLASPPAARHRVLADMLSRTRFAGDVAEVPADWASFTSFG